MGHLAPWVVPRAPAPYSLVILLQCDRERDVVRILSSALAAFLPLLLACCGDTDQHGSSDIPGDSDSGEGPRPRLCPECTQGEIGPTCVLELEDCTFRGFEGGFRLEQSVGCCVWLGPYTGDPYSDSHCCAYDDTACTTEVWEMLFGEERCDGQDNDCNGVADDVAEELYPIPDRPEVGCFPTPDDYLTIRAEPNRIPVGGSCTVFIAAVDGEGRPLFPPGVSLDVRIETGGGTLVPIGDSDEVVFGTGGTAEVIFLAGSEPGVSVVSARIANPAIGVRRTVEVEITVVTE